MAASKATAARPRPPTDPGAYFLSLTVENVRCFGPAQTLDLSDGHGRPAQWTVILGENNLGKSTLLECLISFEHLRSNLNDLPIAPSYRELLDILRRANARPASIVIEYARGSSILDSQRPYRIDSLSLDDFRDRLGNLATSKVEPTPACFAYGANRQPPSQLSRSLRGPQVYRPQFLDEAMPLRNPEDWLLTADYHARLAGAEEFQVQAQQIKAALIRILPEVEDIRIRPPERPAESALVEAKTPDGWVPLRQLGFGYQSQVAWLVDFASRMFERHPDSPDPLAEPAVVLVDEIDLHMHPLWQRQIIGYLTERCPNTQFIVTAHSPLVVQAAAGANIVLLRREGDHVVIDNDPEVLENWRVDQILTSELFGLESARPPRIEPQLKERRALLAKPRLSKADQRRLAELETQIGELPAGESAEDRRAMELIRRAAEKLQSGA